LVADLVAGFLSIFLIFVAMWPRSPKIAASRLTGRRARTDKIVSVFFVVKRVVVKVSVAKRAVVLNSVSSNLSS
jgi:hypothetical protein